MIHSRLLVFFQFFFLGLLLLSWNTQVLLYSAEIKLFFMALAVALFIWTVLYNRLGNFNIVPEIKHGCELITQGPYRFIRHPMYSGVTLIALAEMVSLFSLWKIPVLLFLIGILYLKASREEKFWCEKTPEYVEFQKRTKMFIPFVL
jgi:protein-S-isoprenylcysteine O-methyltransferase Ste14